MRVTRVLAPAIALILASGAPLAGQDWRTIDVSRQLLDSSEHRIRVRYPMGRLFIRSTADPVLYSMLLRYDETRMKPLHRYDADARSVTLGFDGDDFRMTRARRAFDETEMTLVLTEVAPLDLDLEIGAAEARLDVGGLALSRLRVETGAADARLDFSAPNKARMRRLDVQLGAAGFVIRNLGNARVREIHVEGGVGKVDLDFGGTLEDDVDVDANVAIGKLSLRLPREVGVRVELQRVIAGFEHSGLVKRGGAYYSDNWDTARVRMRVRAETVFGAVAIDRDR